MREEDWILWRRLDKPGYEHCRLSSRAPIWFLEGSAVFAHEGLPCRLDYGVGCDAEWRTVAARVGGWVGDRPIDLEIEVSPARRWKINQIGFPELQGCDDLDLNFSPSTNTLPINRLRLEIGQEAPVRAAFLPFPSFLPEPLEQVYRRVDATTYRYASAGGAFVRDLTVNEAGLVTLYPDFFATEAGG